jgi:undecaprenyl-diphosphatase
VTGPADAPLVGGRWVARTLVAAGLGLLLVGAGVAASLPSGPAGPADATWYRWMVEAEASWLVTVAEALDFIGGAAVMLPLSIAVGIGLAWQRRWTALVFWTIASLGAEAASTLIKLALDRERPPLPLTIEATSSFPSGHSKTAVVVTLGLVLVFTVPGLRRRWLLGAAVAYSLVMAWSRTYLRVHWLTDVVGGLALGTVVTLAVLLAVWWIRRGEAEAATAEP